MFRRAPGRRDHRVDFPEIMHFTDSYFAASLDARESREIGSAGTLRLSNICFRSFRRIVDSIDTQVYRDLLFSLSRV